MQRTFDKLLSTTTAHRDAKVRRPFLGRLRGGLEGRSPSKKLFYFASHLLLLGLNLPGRAEARQVKAEK